MRSFPVFWNIGRSDREGPISLDALQRNEQGQASGRPNWAYQPSHQSGSCGASDYYRFLAVRIPSVGWVPLTRQTAVEQHRWRRCYMDKAAAALSNVTHRNPPHRSTRTRGWVHQGLALSRLSLCHSQPPRPQGEGARTAEAACLISIKDCSPGAIIPAAASRESKQ